MSRKDFKWGEIVNDESEIIVRSAMYMIPEGLDKFRIIVVDDDGHHRSLTSTGIDGKSAYEIAVEHGYIGTESDWLNTLIGQPGLSAYEIALANGFTGSEAQWLTSLNGTNGQSATISIGSVTSLSPNQQPTITNSGTSSNAVFNFGIPVGEVGLYNSYTAGAPDQANKLIKRFSKVTNQLLTYEEITTNHNNLPISDVDVTGDGFYIKEGNKYYKQVLPDIIDVRNIGLIPGQNCGKIFNRHLDRLKDVGATFYFPVDKQDYIFEEKIIIPYTVINNTPTQKPFKIIGSGSYSNGKEIGQNGKKGSTIQLAYQGSGSYLDSKVISYGLGLIVLEDITFEDSSGNNSPFFYGTYTTYKVDRCAFLGSKVGLDNDQDVFVFGGTDQTEVGDNPNGGFQGYGTIISNNYFNRIRRGVVGQNYFNGSVIENNTFWFQCGNALGGAIELDASNSNQNNAGNLIKGNLVEMLHYKNFFKGRKATQNSFIGNNLFDAHSTTVAYYDFTDCEYNTVVHGFHNDSAADTGIVIPTIVGSKNQTEITSHQSQPSMISNLNVNDLIVSTGGGILQSAKMKDSTSDLMFFNRYFKANKEYVTTRKNEDGSETDFLMIKDYGGGYFMYNLKGSNETRVVAEQKLKLWCGVGSEIYIGDNSGSKGILMYNGGMRFFPQNESDVITNSLFLDSSTGKLSFKDSSGIVNSLY